MKQELEFKIEGKEWVSLQDAAFNKLNKKYSEKKREIFFGTKIGKSFLSIRTTE